MLTLLFQGGRGLWSHSIGDSGFWLIFGIYTRGGYSWVPYGLPREQAPLTKENINYLSGMKEGYSSCYESKAILMLWLQVRLPPCLPFYFLDLGCKGLTPPTSIPFAWWNNKPNLKHEPDLSYKSHLTSYKWPYEWIPFKMVPSVSNFTFSKRKGGQIFTHLTTAQHHPFSSFTLHHSAPVDQGSLPFSQSRACSLMPLYLRGITLSLEDLHISTRIPAPPTTIPLLSSLGIPCTH